MVLQEIVRAIRQEGEFSSQVTHYCIDSRLAREGSLFFALRGERADGHDFLEEVAKRKAVAAVVSKEYRGESFGLPLFRVDDVTQMLQELAKKKIATCKGRIIGITGSVGKTTTKEFLATLLEKKFSLYKTPFSYNSKVTLPLNILNAKGNEELFILEMAMSKRGEIMRLIEIAPPEFAIITKIGKTHTEFFPDGIEGVARAKGEILESPMMKCAVIHKEALRFPCVAQRGCCKRLSFGDEGSDFVLKRVSDGFVITEEGQRSPPFSLPFTATHLCSNFLAAAALARVLGLGWEEIGDCAKELKPLKNRFETLVREGIVFVNDSYNASAESTKAALSNLPKPKKRGKTFFVFGEMRELGVLSRQSHEEVGEAAADRVDHLFCLGKECQPTMDVLEAKGKKVDLFGDFKSLKEMLFRHVTKGDVVLIKGANSHQLWRLLE